MAESQQLVSQYDIAKRKFPSTEDNIPKKIVCLDFESAQAPHKRNQENAASSKQVENISNDEAIFDELNKSMDLFESDDEFENFVSSLPESVMDGSQPLPGENQFRGSELPDEILEAVFATLPVVDMLCSSSLVCQRWRNIIQSKKYMPWKKIYHKVRLLDQDITNDICSKLDSFSLKTPNDHGSFSFVVIVNVIKFLCQFALDSLSSDDLSSLKTSLAKHRHYGFASDLVRVRVFAEQSEEVSEDTITRTICAAIVVLCHETEEVQDLVKLMNKILPHHVVMDFLYAAAAVLWISFLAWSISQEHHYRIVCAIAAVENASIPLPVNPNWKLDAPMGFPLTHEQRRVAGHEFKPEQLVRVIAYAGAGKTSTLIACVKAHPQLRFLYTSFSKAVVDAGREIFQNNPNVKCNTLHSLAFRAMNMIQYQNKVQRGSIRARDVRERLGLPDEDTSLAVLIMKAIVNFVSSNAEKLCMRHVPTIQRVKRSDIWIVEEVHSVDRKRALDFAKLFWKKTSDLTKDWWPMTDDGYLKMWQLTSPDIYGYDVIMLDEAQDCSECMRDILERQQRHTALVFVGDSHQQIYAFRKARDALMNVNHTHTYYLTQSFRFGGHIAQVADCILRTFKFSNFVPFGARKTNGSVSDKTLFGVGKRGTISGEVIGTHAFLCRTNLGVIFQTLKCLADSNMKDKTVAIVGGAEKLGLDIIQDLYALSLAPNQRKEKGLTIKRGYLRRFRNWRDCYEEANRTDDQELLNKMEIVKSLGERVPEAIKQLRALPKNYKEADIVVSTIHKAKGLEFDTVTICDDFSNQLTKALENHLFDTCKEEANLLYVATTRAKRSLIMPFQLREILKRRNVRFLQLVPTKSLEENNPSGNRHCVSCHNVIETKTFATFVQPSIKGPGYSEEPGPICPNCTMTKAPGWITIAAGPEVTDERYLNLLLPEVDDDGDSDDELVLDPEVYVSDEEDSSDSDGDERHVV